MDQLPRAQARDRAVLRTLIAGGGLQIAIALSVLAALPFLARDLSTDEFGVFATLAGFAALLSFADFGVGGSLTTRLAVVRARDDVVGARRLVSTAVLAGWLIGAGVGLALGISAWALPWQSILGADTVPENDIRRAVLAAAVTAGLAVPAIIGQRLMYGIGRGAEANVQLAAGAVLGTVALVVGTSLDWPLFSYVLIALGTPGLAGLSCGITAVTRYSPQLRPELRLASAGEWRELRRATGWHLAIAVAGAVSFQTDLLVVSGILGAGAAGIYGVAQRAFGLISQSLTPALLQLWPAFGDAHGRGDNRWMRSRIAIATAATGSFAALASGLLVVLGPSIIKALFTESLVPSRGLLIALAVWTTYSVISAPTFMLLNATGYVHLHAKAAMAVAVVNLPLSIWLTHQVGVAGPAWGSLIASVLCSAPVGVYGLRKVFSSRVSS